MERECTLRAEHCAAPRPDTMITTLRRPEKEVEVQLLGAAPAGD
jgi:hypothetical protein